MCSVWFSGKWGPAHGLGAVRWRRRRPVQGQVYFGQEAEPMWSERASHLSGCREKRMSESEGVGGGDNAVLASQHHIPLVLNTLTSFSTSLSTTPARERIHHFSNLICLCSLVYYYYYYLFPRIVTRIFLDFMRQLGRAWGTVRRASFSSLVTAGETFTRHFLLCRGAARASALLSPI